MSEILHPRTQNEQAKQQLFENRLYGKKELANILRVSVKTIDVLMAKKSIKYSKIGAAVRFNGNYLNERFDSL